MKDTSSRRRWAGLVLAGALATTGMVAVTQAADAPAAEAAVCGSAYLSNGYAYASNPCGYSYAEVRRNISNRVYAVGAYSKHKSWVSVSWKSGSRFSERAVRW